MGVVLDIEGAYVLQYFSFYVYCYMFYYVNLAYIL